MLYIAIGRLSVKSYRFIIPHTYIFSSRFLFLVLTSKESNPRNNMRLI